MRSFHRTRCKTLCCHAFQHAVSSYRNIVYTYILCGKTACGHPTAILQYFICGKTACDHHTVYTCILYVLFAVKPHAVILPQYCNTVYTYVLCGKTACDHPTAILQYNIYIRSLRSNRMRSSYRNILQHTQQF